MTLTDVRRYAVRHRARIEFTSSQGAAIAIDEHGVARVEGLTAAPGFTVTEEFERAAAFVLVRGGQRQSLERARLDELAGKGAAVVAHDEEE